MGPFERRADRELGGALDRGALQRTEKRAHHEQERDKDGHRVPGQADERRAVDPAVEERLAGFQVQPPEIQTADALERLPHVVLLAH
jgi:hypothetical protein